MTALPPQITDENYAHWMRKLVEIEGQIMDMAGHGEYMSAEQARYYNALRTAILDYRREHVKQIF